MEAQLWRNMICLILTCTVLLTRLESSSKLATSLSKRADIAEKNDERTSIILKTITDAKDLETNFKLLHKSTHTTFAKDGRLSDKLRDLKKAHILKRLDTGKVIQDILKLVNGSLAILKEEDINEDRHGPRNSEQRRTDHNRSRTLRRSKRNVNGTREAASSHAFFDDNNNTAMHLVLPLIILVYGGCCSIYCIYKLKNYIRIKRLKRKQKQLVKKQGLEHFSSDESSAGFVNEGFQPIPDNDSENQSVKQDTHKQYLSENKLLEESEDDKTGRSRGKSNPPPGYPQMEVTRQITPTISAEVESLSLRVSAGLPNAVEDEDAQIEEIRAAMGSVLHLNDKKRRMSADIQSTCSTTLRRSSLASPVVTSQRPPSLKRRQQSTGTISLQPTELKTTQSKKTTKQQFLVLKSRQSVSPAKREMTVAETKQSKVERNKTTKTNKTPQDDINQQSFDQQSGGGTVDQSKDIAAVKSNVHASERSVGSKKHQNITAIIRHHQGAKSTESMIETSREDLKVSKENYEMDEYQQELRLKNHEDINDSSKRSIALANRRTSGVDGGKSNMVEETTCSIDIVTNEKNKVDIVSSHTVKLVRVENTQSESIRQDHSSLSKRSSAESGIFEQEDTKPKPVVNHKPDDVPKSGENNFPIIRRKRVKQRVFSCT